jgi:hypothetical protein
MYSANVLENDNILEDVTGGFIRGWRAGNGD